MRERRGEGGGGLMSRPPPPLRSRPPLPPSLFPHSDNKIGHAGGAALVAALVGLTALSSLDVRCAVPRSARLCPLQALLQGQGISGAGGLFLWPRNHEIIGFGVES